jgi:hypothetical protein
MTKALKKLTDDLGDAQYHYDCLLVQKAPASKLEAARATLAQLRQAIAPRLPKEEDEDVRID